MKPLLQEAGRMKSTRRSNVPNLHQLSGVRTLSAMPSGSFRHELCISHAGLGIRMSRLNTQTLTQLAPRQETVGSSTRFAS